jgi:esterase/lipase superfamily enzyme
MSLSARILLLALAAAALAGCAGRPHGVLTPARARAPGTSEVAMLVATTRSQRGAEPGELFSGERGEALSYADIAVSIPPKGARQIGEVQWPSGNPGDPAREFVTLRADVIGRDEALAKFDARIARTPKRQVLVFVHGYNTRFEEAVFRFAQIAHDSGASALPVLFTWPSRGKLLAYGYDHESASYSRDALEAVLRALDRDKNVGEISILAHSMGNWVTLEALRQMAIRDKGLAPKIRNVMLAAPDVDFDVFQRQIHQIGARPSLFTVFISRDDEALAAARRVWGDKVRLGAVDPAREPYQEDLARDRVNVVDLTDVTSSDHIGHTKFAEAPEVVRSIGLRLSQGQTLSDSQAGVGDKIGQAAIGAASTMGGAAGVAVSLPLAVVDPRTRDNLADRLEDLAARASETAESSAAAARAPLR